MIAGNTAAAEFLQQPYFLFGRANFKSPQKFLKFIAAILKRGVFGGYLFNSHAQTTALISSTLIF